MRNGPGGNPGIPRTCPGSREDMMNHKGANQPQFSHMSADLKCYGVGGRGTRASGGHSAEWREGARHCMQVTERALPPGAQTGVRATCRERPSHGQVEAGSHHGPRGTLGHTVHSTHTVSHNDRAPHPAKASAGKDLARVLPYQLPPHRTGPAEAPVIQGLHSPLPDVFMEDY